MKPIRGLDYALEDGLSDDGHLSSKSLLKDASWKDHFFV